MWSVSLFTIITFYTLIVIITYFAQKTKQIIKSFLLRAIQINYINNDLLTEAITMAKIQRNAVKSTFVDVREGIFELN